MSDILLAYEGHVEKLKAVNGGGEEKNNQISNAQDFLAAFSKHGVKR